MALHFLPNFLWLLLCHSQGNTTGIRLLWSAGKPQGEKRHVQEGVGLNEVWFFDYILCFFPSTPYSNPLGGCTSSNNKYWLWLVCKSRQGSSSAGTEEQVWAPSQDPVQEPCQHWSGGTEVWAVVFPEAVKSKLEQQSPCHFDALTSPELEGPKD